MVEGVLQDGEDTLLVAVVEDNIWVPDEDDILLAVPAEDIVREDTLLVAVVLDEGDTLLEALVEDKLLVLDEDDIHLEVLVEDTLQEDTPLEVLPVVLQDVVDDRRDMTVPLVYVPPRVDVFRLQDDGSLVLALNCSLVFAVHKFLMDCQQCRRQRVPIERRPFQLDEQLSCVRHRRNVVGLPDDEPEMFELLSRQFHLHRSRLLHQHNRHTVELQFFA